MQSKSTFETSLNIIQKGCININLASNLQMIHHLNSFSFINHLFLARIIVEVKV